MWEGPWRSRVRENHNKVHLLKKNYSQLMGKKEKNVENIKLNLGKNKIHPTDFSMSTKFWS